jgi:hypothetical protein
VTKRKVITVEGRSKTKEMFIAGLKGAAAGEGDL